MEGTTHLRPGKKPGTHWIRWMILKARFKWNVFKSPLFCHRRVPDLLLSSPAHPRLLTSTRWRLWTHCKNYTPTATGRVVLQLLVTTNSTVCSPSVHSTEIHRHFAEPSQQFLPLQGQKITVHTLHITHNPLAPELDIYSLAHHLCKMLIFYERRRVTLGNTRHFVEE